MRTRVTHPACRCNAFSLHIHIHIHTHVTDSRELYVPGEAVIVHKSAELEFYANKRQIAMCNAEEPQECNGLPCLRNVSNGCVTYGVEGALNPSYFHPRGGSYLHQVLHLHGDENDGEYWNG